MYSWYAQMGRHPHKLRLQTPDATPPHPVRVLPVSSSSKEEARDRFPRYEVAGYFPVQEKEKSEVHIFGGLLVTGSP